MNLINTKGACKHCGQIIILDIDEDAAFSQQEIDELASKRCDCEIAKIQRDIENSISDAIEDVDKMFPESENIRGYVKQACELVGREYVENITIKIDSRTKAQIKKTTKGKIRVERVVKNTESREH